MARVRGSATRPKALRTVNIASARDPANQCDDRNGSPSCVQPSGRGQNGRVRYRWLVLAAGTFAQATYSAIWFGAAVMAPALRDEYDLSLAQTGFLISGSLAGSVLSMIGLAPYGPGVSAATKAAIAKKHALLKSGKWNEFSGPIYDQKGKLRIKKGDRPTVQELYAMTSPTGYAVYASRRSTTFTSTADPS